MSAPYQVALSPIPVRPGETVIITVVPQQGSAPACIQVWPRTMRDWVITLAPEAGQWVGRRRVPAWVAPGRYEWEVAADGQVVATVTGEVVWPQIAQRRAAAWRRERGRLARAEAERWDAFWAAQDLPRFRYLGVWFDGGFYTKYGNPPGPAGRDAPFARATAGDEVRYLHEELGCNMMMLYGVDEATQRYAAEHLDLLAGPGGQYRFLDEPDALQWPMPEVAAWVERTEREGLVPIVNFCGHSSGDWWDGYARAYLAAHRAPVVSVDCYPVFYDMPNLSYFSRRVTEVGRWARAAGSRFLVIAQGFACLGKWAMPSPEQIVEMARASHQAGAEGLLFFLWTSGWKGPHDEYLVGLDAMPLSYHRLLRALHAPER